MRALCGQSSRVPDTRCRACYGRPARSRTRSSARLPAAGWSSMSLPITGSGRRIPTSCTIECRRNAQHARLPHVQRAWSASSTPAPWVHRSSARTGLGDEDQPVSLDDMAGAISVRSSWPSRSRSSSRATGFPVVIVNPTAPMGDHDFKPTPTGQIVLDFLNGAMPAYIDTGLNVVNVRDVARGHLLACERGRTGRAVHPRIGEYDAGADSAELAAITGRKLRPSQLPYFVAYAAGVVTTAWARSHRHPAARAARSCPHGEEEDVGFARESFARLGYAPGPARRGSGRRGRVVSGISSGKSCMSAARTPLLFIAAEPRECAPWVSRWEDSDRCICPFIGRGPAGGTGAKSWPSLMEQARTGRDAAVVSAPHARRGLQYRLLRSARCLASGGRHLRRHRVREWTRSVSHRNPRGPAAKCAAVPDFGLADRDGPQKRNENFRQCGSSRCRDGSRRGGSRSGRTGCAILLYSRCERSGGRGFRQQF